MQTNVIINATTTAGKKLATTITYVNSAASNSALAQLAQKINSLTTNTYVNATKETKGEVL